MIRSRLALGCASIVLAGTSCATDLDPLLFLDIDNPPPAETTAPEVMISGTVVRTPPSQQVSISVTVTGGAQTVTVPTNDFRVFNVTVPLTLNAGNVLQLIAEDSDGTRSQPREFTVTQLGTPVVMTRTADRTSWPGN